MEFNELRVANLLHGADYNPEQWLDRPDILAKDIELMKEAHCNVVSMGMFSWSMLEPEEGVYQFEWLESVINNLLIMEFTRFFQRQVALVHLG